MLKLMAIELSIWNWWRNVQFVKCEPVSVRIFSFFMRCPCVNNYLGFLNQLTVILDMHNCTLS